jgi:O-antigen/teichoic acid export membrane protein
MIQKIKPKSEFSKNVLTLMTGTSIAQAIPIAISPILTRIYTPEDFGIFALYISIASMIALIATGRYELAIMLPRKDEDAINIVALSIIISFIVSFISFLVVFIFNAQITNLLGNEEISNWLYFIPMTVLLTGIYQSFNYWSNRKKQYKRLATSRVLQSSATATTNLGMGFNGFGSSGLVLGGIMGQGVATGILAKMIWKEDNHRINQIKKLKIFALMKKYIDFPKINMFHAFINDAKNFIVNILLVKFYDTFILGQFYMINRILLLPVGLIGSSISQVIFRVYNEKYNKKQDFSKDVLTMVLKLFLFALIPFLIIFFLGNEIFTLVFGQNWGIAGDLASAYALYVLFHFVASPLSIVSLIVRKQLTAFYWNLTGTFVYIISIITGYVVFDRFESVLLFLSCMMLVYFLLYINWIYKISKLIRY